MKRGDRNGNQSSNGQQPFRQSVDGPQEPGAITKQGSGQDGSPAPLGVMTPIDEVAGTMTGTLRLSGTGVKRSWSDAGSDSPPAADYRLSRYPADDNSPEQPTIQSAPTGQKMPYTMNHLLEHYVHDGLLGFQPLSLVVHLPESTEGKEFGEVGVFRSMFIGGVRGFDLCGVSEEDLHMRCSFLNVLSFLEENKPRLEKWLGRSLRWPRDDQGFQVTFDACGGTSRPRGPSSGGAIFLSLIRLLAGVPLRRFIAITWTVSTSGHFHSVGSVPAKLDAAMDVAVTSAIVPIGNYYALKRQDLLKKYDKVVAAKDVVDILHHCLDAQDVQLPDPQVMRKELSDDLIGRQVVVVKVATWTHGLRWDLKVLEARATVKHGAGPGGVVLNGAAEDLTPSKCVVHDVVDWIVTHQKQLEVVHGHFYIDFSSYSTQRTATKAPVHIELAVAPGQLGSHYMVPVAVSLISIATGRRLKDEVAFATSAFEKCSGLKESDVFPIQLPRDDDSTQALAGLESRKRTGVPQGDNGSR